MNFECQPEGIVTFQYLLNDGDFQIGLAPMDFTTHWSTRGGNSIYSYNKVQKTFRIHNFTAFDVIRRTSDIPIDALVPFKWGITLGVGDGIVCVNKNNFIAIGKVQNVYVSSEDELESKVTLQYRILNPIDITDDFIMNEEV